MIQTTDVKFYLSAPQAGSGYVMPGSPGNSLGKYVSTTQLSATTLDNLFPDLTGAQNAADQVDYACLFIYNGNASDTMISPVAWLPTALLGNTNTATFAIGADINPPSVLGSGSVQAAVISSATVAPTGVASWHGPSAASVGGVALPNIPAQYTAAIWIQRSAGGGAGLNTFSVDVTFDTVA